MPKFRNTRTGRVAKVADRPATRTERPGREKQWANMLTRMDKSTRWERVPDSTPVGMPRNAPKRGKSKATKAEPPPVVEEGQQTSDEGAAGAGQES